MDEHCNNRQAGLNVFLVVARRFDDSGVAENLERAGELMRGRVERNASADERPLRFDVHLLVAPGKFQRLKIAKGEVSTHETIGERPALLGSCFFRSERGDDFLEAWIAAQRIPKRT